MSWETTRIAGIIANKIQTPLLIIKQVLFFKINFCVILKSLNTINAEKFNSLVNENL